MLTVATTDNGVTLRFELRQPGIYLDHCALRIISSTAEYRNFFLQTFTTRGTLFFSMVNLIDFIGNSRGPSADSLVELLGGIGDRWIPIAFNPLDVIEREKYIKRDAGAAFDEGFAKLYYPRVHGEPDLSLSKVVELSQSEEMKNYKVEKLDPLLSEFAVEMNSNKKEWQTNRKIQKRFLDELKRLRKVCNTEYVYRSLQLILFKNSFQFTKNHIVDFWHTVVPLANADMLVLDKHWSNIARQVDLPATMAHVFSVVEVEKFLEAFAEAKIVP